MEQERPKVGLGIVIVRQQEVLIGKRLGAHGAQTWCLPGGHVEFGESWEVCARREAREETGLEIENVLFLGVTDNNDIGEGKHYVTIFMKADVPPSATPRICEPDKYVDLHWCAWERIPSPRFQPLDKLMRQGVHPLARHYGKLVRDRIADIIHERGEVAITHEATFDEYTSLLQAKLLEEVQEYLQSENVEELADVSEVIHALSALHGTNREQLQLIQNQKREDRGGFEKRIVLEETRPV